ncbi:Cytochrome [Forsythia ovata]|uniref:Complex III subunit VI n=1 Tax=Forsythia ovata TaxID=205694 RepID=A0ABD1TLU4_9LAMI
MALVSYILSKNTQFPKESPQTLTVSFYISKSDLEWLTGKSSLFATSKKSELKISIYNGRRGTTCGVNSCRLLDKIFVLLDLTGTEFWAILFHNGADDEPVDPKKELEERCKAPCTRPLREYQACAKRIQGDETGHKHCTGQYFDYWRCVDKCGKVPKAKPSHLCQRPLDKASCKSRDVHEWQGSEGESQQTNPQDRPPQYFSENLSHTGIEPALLEDFSPRHLKRLTNSPMPLGAILIQLSFHDCIICRWALLFYEESGVKVYTMCIDWK